MPIFILFLPAIAGAVTAIISWLVRLGPVVSWLIRYLSACWPAIAWFLLFCGRVAGFIFSFKGFLVLVAAWVVASLCGWGDQFTEFIVGLISFVGTILFNFFFR